MLDGLTTSQLLLAFGMPGGWEWIVLLVLGLIIFGRRLPDVGRSLGRSIVEFKKGIKGIEEEIEQESARPAARLADQAPIADPLDRSRTSEQSHA